MWRDHCQSASSVTHASELAPRLRASGYTGVQMSCSQGSSEWWGEEKRKIHAQVVGIFRAHGLDVIPGVWSLGYGELLPQYPDMAEGRPLKGLRYVVRDGKAVFSESDGPFPVADAYKDIGRGRAYAKFTLRPYRRYRAHGTVELGNVGSDCRFVYYVKPANPAGREPRYKRNFGERCINVKAGGSTAFTLDYTFETGEGVDCDSFCGVWQDGVSVNVRDFSLREIPPDLLPKNDGCPLSVRSARTGAPYLAGRDFADFRGMPPFRFDDLQGPELREFRILPGGGVSEGEELLVDCYQASRAHRGQISVCLSHPRLWERIEASARSTYALLRPKDWMIGINEYRNGGTCAACRMSGKTMGQLLGETVTAMREAVRRQDPAITVFIWSDMFDPLLNAHEDFYSCATTFAESWKHVPRDIVMLYWDDNPKKAAAALDFFSAEGFRTLVGSYYDHDANDPAMSYTRQQVEAGFRTRGCMGFMYCSWKGDDRRVEDFARVIDTIRTRTCEAASRQVSTGCHASDADGTNGKTREAEGDRK